MDVLRSDRTQGTVLGAGDALPPPLPFRAKKTGKCRKSLPKPGTSGSKSTTPQHPRPSPVPQCSLSREGSRDKGVLPSLLQPSSGKILVDKPKHITTCQSMWPNRMIYKNPPQHPSKDTIPLLSGAREGVEWESTMDCQWTTEPIHYSGHLNLYLLRWR